jgi:2-methylaconitate cis-trans-isomerase PrpF
MAHLSGNIAGEMPMNATSAAMPRDAEIADVLGRAGKEAQEAITYHRSQLVMWERVQAAAHAGLAQLESDPEPMQAEGPVDAPMKRGW